MKTTVEVGGFVEYLPSETIRLRADLRKGLGGHEGLVGSIGADRIWRDGDRYVFSIGPRVLFSSARFQEAYFGVDSAAALASGLPAYRPDGGVYAVAAARGCRTNSVPAGAFGFARYERLVGDAADSPIVRDLGSRNQLSGGIGLSYVHGQALSRRRQSPAPGFGAEIFVELASSPLCSSASAGPSCA